MKQPLYRARADPETFVVEEVLGTPSPQRPRPGRELVYPSALLKPSFGGDLDNEGRFRLACAVLRAGEREQRQAIRRKLARRTRNIDLSVRRTLDYLAQMTPEKKPRKGEAVNKDELAQQMKEALEPIRMKLGLGCGCPGEFSYRITDEVLASTHNEALRRRLRSRIPLGDLFAPGLAALRDFLEGEFPEEAAAVYGALEGTRTREHICAISLQHSGEDLWITIVNAEGGLLTLEAFKLIALLEASGTSRRLHQITWQDARSSELHFVFNHQKEGEVIGKFDAASGCLQVLCWLGQEKGPGCRDRFILDLDYLLCLYLVLKRLREDRERFVRLLEIADATPSIDPFEHLTH